MNRLLASLVALVFFAVSAEAAPSYRATSSMAKNLRRSEIRLAKAIAGLKATDREKLKKAISALGVDSDTDGVSDIFERARGSNVCDDDSDDDGIEDSEDGYEEDDDKQDEMEGLGQITSFDDPILVLGGRSITVTDRTRFRKGISSKEDLTEGRCIKIEGYIDPDNVPFATKIEGSSKCAGSPDDDGDDD
jgi:hypothetical protein